MTRKVIHDEHLNTYSFLFNSTKIVLLLKKEQGELKSIEEVSSLLKIAKFEEELQNTQVVYALIGKLESANGNIP